MTTINTKLEISKEIFDRCTEFASNSVSSSADKYAHRNQTDIAKIMRDIRNGKIAEEIVYSVFSKQYPNLSKPDLKIYSKKDKSWDPDLKDTSSDLRIAVKSRDIEYVLHYNESWVFQFGNGKKDCDTGVFGNNVDDNHYVSFVVLNIPKKIATLRAVVKIPWLHNNDLFKKMERENLQANKMAVYYEDLAKYPTELWQLNF